MDQLTAMRAFVRIAETGSFSAVAREQNTTQATISKRIAALEEKLGVKLLIRSSRHQMLTEAGQVYFRRVHEILDAVDDTESEVRQSTTSPRGTLKITAPVDFACHVFYPILHDFLEQYTDINIDLVLRNDYIDLIESGIDVAIRVGNLPDSSMIAKTVTKHSLCMVASPDYLENYGEPSSINDISNHECIIYLLAENRHVWVLNDHGKSVMVPVSGRLLCNNGDIIVEAAKAGKGLALLPYWLACEELAKGTLKSIMQTCIPKPLAVNVVYLDRKHIPLKVRLFIDFFSERMRNMAFQAA